MMAKKEPPQCSTTSGAILTVEYSIVITENPT